MHPAVANGVGDIMHTLSPFSHKSRIWLTTFTSCLKAIVASSLVCHQDMRRFTHAQQLRNGSFFYRRQTVCVKPLAITLGGNQTLATTISNVKLKTLVPTDRSAAHCDICF